LEAQEEEMKDSDKGGGKFKSKIQEALLSAEESVMKTISG
jgi:hypothetical protein